MKLVHMIVAGLVALPLIWACPEPGLTPEEQEQARHVIFAWLECEECEQGELEAVTELGEVAVPSLAASLRQGPSPASREKLRRHLIDTYQKLIEYGQTHPEARIDMTEEQYVRTYMDNYVALYRVRSATALGAIGGRDARRALEEASGAEIRDDVRAAVSEAMAQLERQ